MTKLVPRSFGFSRFSGLYVFAVFVIVFSIWRPETFPTQTTAQTVAANQAITGIAALGLVCALSVGAFDLSIAGVIGVSQTVAAALMVREGTAPGLTILIVLGLGIAVGLINGLLVVRFKINSVVATLGMSSILLALDDEITQGQFITPVPNSFTHLTSGKVAGIPAEFL